MPQSALTLIIGIDPDVDKSGFAVKDSTDKSITLYTLRFFQIFDYLSLKKDLIKEVRIEASWLNSKSNWHTQNSTHQAAAKIGKNAGSNHEVGRKLVEMCQYLKIPYLEVKPLRKCWKGRDGKITHDELAKMVKLDRRTNQEMRDACLLIL